jgi:hypothetical protein
VFPGLATFQSDAVRKERMALDGETGLFMCKSVERKVLS